MSLHRLSKSKRLLSAIGQLGKVLGYHVALEHPLPAPTEAEAPALDVAWFGSADDRFPLMLFEVESVASNAMANNAVKVFGQETAVFEKPLFFFHVVTTGGSQSSRPQVLERAFGTHNYRIYRLSDGDGTQLICDVLAQHRRVRSVVDFAKLYEACEHDDWGGSVDPVVVLRFARDQGLSPDEYLPDLIHLARTRRSLLEEARATVDDPTFVRWLREARFRAWLATHYGYGLLLSLFLGASQSPEEIQRWSARVEDWQRGSYGMEMIAPLFGLDREYDDFILGGAGAFVALLVATSRRQGACCESLCRALGQISARLGASWEGANVHVWTCHVAAFLGLADVFSIGQRNVDALGGLPQEFIVSPVPLVRRDERRELERPNRMRIPSMDEFRAMVQAAHSGSDVDVDEIALRALDENEFVTSWSEPILRCLWQPTPRARTYR